MIQPPILVKMPSTAAYRKEYPFVGAAFVVCAFFAGLTLAYGYLTNSASPAPAVFADVSTSTLLNEVNTSLAGASSTQNAEALLQLDDEEVAARDTRVFVPSFDGVTPDEADSNAIASSVPSSESDVSVEPEAVTPSAAPDLHVVPTSSPEMSTSNTDSTPIPASTQAPTVTQVQESVKAPEVAVQQKPKANIIARAALVYDITDDTVLFEKNADTQLPLASLTKVPLALTVNEVLDPESVITLAHAIPATGSGSGMPKGSRWKVKDILAYTLMASSNEGAEVLADAADDALRSVYANAAAGAAAVTRMNDLASSLGLTQTYFVNPSGLDESSKKSGAYGSARDVSKLFSYAASTSADIFAPTSEGSMSFSSLDGYSTWAKNTDHAVDSFPGLILGKTGYTLLAHGNLAIVYKVGEKKIVAVVLGSSQQGRFSDMRALVTLSKKVLE